MKENPISEKGSWAGGSSAGDNLWIKKSFWEGKMLWGNVQTDSGLAFGVDEPTQFGDPTAILKGTWAPTQIVIAKVRVSKVPSGPCCHEVELRLRTTISTDSITGYEAYCSVMPSARYCTIARWNGPNGSWWNIASNNQVYAMDGDVMEARITGTNPTVITLYKNGAQIVQAIDTGKAGGGFGAFGPWTSGNPGIGFYDDPDSDWKAFGFTSFSASDGSGGSIEQAGPKGAQ